MPKPVKFIQQKNVISDANRVNMNVSDVPKQKRHSVATRLKGITGLTKKDTEDAAGRFLVYCRVRPMSLKEKRKGYHQVVECNTGSADAMENYVTIKEEMPGEHPREKSYAFDNVFSELSTNLEVYQHTLTNLIDNALEGYNGTCFSYGSVGTGKTHTMFGDVNYDRGLMYLCFQDLFAHQSSFPDSEFNVAISFVEIFNEQIRDLLSPRTRTLDLKEEDAGVIITDVTYHPVREPNDIFGYLAEGLNRRTRDSTFHTTSSKSHAILQIFIERIQHLEYTDEIARSKLNLIDLAGFERGEALLQSEVKTRNRSLQALHNCISALVERRKFVPYRESKLTRLLKDSLGGTSATVMIATVAPGSNQFEETLRTLKEADRAKNILLQTTAQKERKQEDYTNIIMTLKGQVVELNAKLADRIGNTTDAGRVGFGLTRKEKHELQTCTTKMHAAFDLAHKNLNKLYRTKAEAERIRLRIEIKRSKYSMILAEDDGEEEHRILAEDEALLRNVISRIEREGKIYRECQKKLDVDELVIRSITVQDLMKKEVTYLEHRLVEEEAGYQNSNLQSFLDLFKERHKLLRQQLSDKEEQFGVASERVSVAQQELDDMQKLNTHLNDKNKYAKMILNSKNKTLLGGLAEEKKKKKKKKSAWGRLFSGRGKEEEEEEVVPTYAVPEVKEPILLPVREWNLIHVITWIESFDKLKKYGALFRDNDITGEDLPEISDSDLKVMGIQALGHRKRILREIRAVMKSFREEPIPVDIHESFGSETDRGSVSDNGSLFQTSESSLPVTESKRSESAGQKERLIKTPQQEIGSLNVVIPEERAPSAQSHASSKASESRAGAGAEASRSAAVQEPFDADLPELAEDVPRDVPTISVERADTPERAPSAQEDPQERSLSGSVREAADLMAGSERSSTMIVQSSVEDMEEELLDKDEAPMEDAGAEPSYLELKKRELLGWTHIQVAQWIRSLDVDEFYPPLFKTEQVDGAMLVQMCEEDFANLGIDSQAHIHFIRGRVDKLRIEHGIFTTITMPDFEEPVQFEFSIGIVCPHPELIPNHIRLWIDDTSEQADEKHVHWWRKIFPYGTESIGMRIGHVKHLSTLSQLKEDFTFIIILLNFGVEVIDSKERDLLERLGKVADESFWKKTLVLLDNGLGFIPGDKIHGMNQDVEHWNSFSRRKLASMKDYFTQLGCHPSLQRVQVIESDTKAQYSEELRTPFAWPFLPNNKDWRVSYVSKILHMQSREIQKFMIAAFYYTPYVLPEVLQDFAHKMIEAKEFEEKQQPKESQELKKISKIQDRLTNLTETSQDMNKTQFLEVQAKLKKKSKAPVSLEPLSPRRRSASIRAGEEEKKQRMPAPARAKEKRNAVSGGQLSRSSSKKSGSQKSQSIEIRDSGNDTSKDQMHRQFDSQWASEERAMRELRVKEEMLRADKERRAELLKIAQERIKEQKAMQKEIEALDIPPSQPSTLHSAPNQQPRKARKSSMSNLFSQINENLNVIEMDSEKAANLQSVVSESLVSIASDVLSASDRPEPVITREPSQKEHEAIMNRFRQMYHEDDRSTDSIPSVVRRLHRVAGDPIDKDDGAISISAASLATDDTNLVHGSQHSLSTRSQSTERTGSELSWRVGGNSVTSEKEWLEKYDRVRRRRRQRPRSAQSSPEKKPRPNPPAGVPPLDARSVLSASTMMSSSTVATGVSVVSVWAATEDEVFEEYSRRLKMIYSVHNPSLLPHVGKLLKKHKYGEHALYKKICNLYNVSAEREWVVEKAGVKKESKSSPKLTSSRIHNHSQPVLRETNITSKIQPSFSDRYRKTSNAI